MAAKILVVDDEQDFVQLICHHLREHPYQIISAETGMKGLQKARRYLPDMILLDMMLPDVDGLSVCEMLRRGSSTAVIPVVLVTAMAGQIARAHAIVSGAEHYLAKPFNRQILCGCVERVLRERSAKIDTVAAAPEGPFLPGRAGEPHGQ